MCISMFPFRFCVRWGSGCADGEVACSHVHETVQPVIQKEVIQPEVIHTAVPIHEVHHNAARIHPTSTKEPVTMSEFQKSGSTLGGSGTRTNAFEGCPQGKGVHETSSSSTKESTMSPSGTTGLGAESTEKKPSLIDRLNPYKDADNDGKKGFMS